MALKVLDIQTLIAEGKIVDLTQIDQTNAYVSLGYWQPGSRKAGDGSNNYPQYVINLNDLLTGAPGAPLIVQDEGVTENSNVLTVNFVGDGVSVDPGATPNTVDINIPGPTPLVTGPTITGSGTVLSPYNAQLLLGSNSLPGTLVVSPLGDDATAVPYDMMRHYSTIAAAVTAAKSGDLIFVYAGNYSVSTNLMKDGVRYYFCEGAVVTVDTVSLFTITTETTSVAGYARFIINSGTFVRANLLATGSLKLQCRSVDDLVNTPVFMEAGTLRLDILEHMKSVFRIVQLQGSPDVTIKCPLLQLTGVYGSYNVFGAVLFRIRSTTNFSGKLYVESEIMESINGPVSLILLNCQTPGSIIINCKKMICRSTTAVPYAILMANTNTGYVEINGDLYANGTGVTSGGIYFLNLAPTTRMNMVYNGNIYMESGVAVRTSSGTVFSYSGNIYGNPTIVPPINFGGADSEPIGSLVWIGRDGVNGQLASQVIIRNSSLNAMNAGTTCIYKAMLIDGSAGASVDAYLELDSVKLYCDAASNSIVGQAPLAPALNTVQMNAVVNTAVVNASITELGDPSVLNTTLKSIYPPIS